ncbi:MAG: UDP-N-acetylmuramoyl-L-alanine--D-glutamate ligase [Balneolaceae bacterium]
MIDVSGKHIVVVGAARSGLAVAALLASKQAEVFVTDTGAIDAVSKKELDKLGIPFEEGGHSPRSKDAELLVISPGVPSEAPIVQQYIGEGKGVYSEIEVASWYNQSPMIAVTGSNGKSTVVNWMADTWQRAERDCLLAGNVGVAFSQVVEQSSPEKMAILEVSSFQLDHIHSFSPFISVLLNVTPDHLDRYNHSFKAYAASKMRITENQTADDWFIYNADDTVCKQLANSLKQRDNTPQQLAFSIHDEVEQGLFLRNGKMICKLNETDEVLMNVQDMGIPGKHNLQNGMATALAARAAEIKNDRLRESLELFEGIPHRLEFVRDLEGVRYFNDSKATNINAVWYALDCFDTPMVLILGGRDKGNDYLELEAQIRKKVHTIIALGEAKENIRSQLGNVVPNLMEADTIQQAVKSAAKQAKRGEVVLLSPACSSFDMFKNYEDRGDQFRQAVINL